MKIAVITQGRYPSTLGSGARPIRLFETISKKHDIHFFYIGLSWITDNRDFKDRDFYVHFVKFPFRDVPKIGIIICNFSKHFFLERIKKYGPFDAIYMDGPAIWSHLVLYASKELSIPLFTDYPDLEFYDQDSRIFQKILKIIMINNFKKILKESRHIFPMCSFLKNRLITFYNISYDKITIIPNGVNTNFFNPEKISGMKIRIKYSLEESIIIGFCGALEKWVRIDILLQAFQNIKKKYHNIKLLIVGNGSELNKWKNLSNALKLNDDVIFTGLVPYQDIPQYIASFDIAVSIFSKSLLTEVVSPLKIIEYMSMEKPIVADNLSGTRDFIIDMKNGILFEPEDSYGLENALCKILNDKKLRNTLEKNAKKLSINYDWKIFSKKIEKIIYQKITTE